MIPFRLEDIHYHGDGRRALMRFFNEEVIGVHQVYTVDIRPGVTTCWHGHERQTDYWVVLEGMLQVGLTEFMPKARPQGFVPHHDKPIHELWMNGAHPQILEIPPGVWHGYHNAGPGMVKLLNMTTEAYTTNPDELRMDLEWIPFEWGKVPVK